MFHTLLLVAIIGTALCYPSMPISLEVNVAEVLSRNSTVCPHNVYLDVNMTVVYYYCTDVEVIATVYNHDTPQYPEQQVHDEIVTLGERNTSTIYTVPVSLYGDGLLRISVKALCGGLVAGLSYIHLESDGDMLRVANLTRNLLEEPEPYVNQTINDGGTPITGVYAELVYYEFDGNGRLFPYARVQAFCSGELVGEGYCNQYGTASISLTSPCSDEFYIYYDTYGSILSLAKDTSGDVWGWKWGLYYNDNGIARFEYWIQGKYGAEVAHVWRNMYLLNLWLASQEIPFSSVNAYYPCIFPTFGAYSICLPYYSWSNEYMVPYVVGEYILYRESGIIIEFSNCDLCSYCTGSAALATGFSVAFSLVALSGYNGTIVTSFGWGSDTVLIPIERYSCTLDPYLNDAGRNAASIYDLVDLANDCNDDDISLGTSIYCDMNSEYVLSPLDAFVGVARRIDEEHIITGSYFNHYREAIIDYYSNSGMKLTISLQTIAYNYGYNMTIPISNSVFFCPRVGLESYYTIVCQNNVYPCNKPVDDTTMTTGIIEVDILLGISFTSRDECVSYAMFVKADLDIRTLYWNVATLESENSWTLQLDSHFTSRMVGGS
jgi:hypothetical protein